MGTKRLSPTGDGVSRTRISWYQAGRKISRILHVELDAARKILAQKLAERDLAAWGQTVPKLYREAVDEFLRNKRAENCKESYLEELARTLKDVLAVRWHKRILSEISPNEVKEYLRARMADDGVSASTAKKDRTMIGTLWAWAVLNGYASRNVIEAVPQIKTEKKPPRFLTPWEFRQLHDAAPAYLQPMLRVLVATGMRAEELCTLRRESVRAGKIMVTDRKCRDFVAIDCPPALAELLLGQPATESGLVFGRPSGAWDKDSLRRAIQAAAGHANLADVSTHDLRHTAATWMLAAGVSIWDVKRTLGHSTVNTTERYSHVAGFSWTVDSAMLPAGMASYVPVVGRQQSPEGQQRQAETA